MTTVAQMTEKALGLITKWEGFNQPWQWPGGASGVTIGIGYDLGQASRTDFELLWKAVLPDADFQALGAAIGVKGTAAQNLANRYRSITIDADTATAVFHDKVLPVYQQLTASAFPGVTRLPPDAQGALVSLVYNRGASMDGDPRQEMRNIRDLLAIEPMPGDLLARIAAEVRAMKRLWPTVGGLRARRDAEADLIAGAGG